MIGQLAALGAALSWTISAVLYRRALSETRPISANIVRCTLTGSILIVFLIVIGRFNILSGLPSYALLLSAVSGIVGLGIGDTLYMVSLKLIGVAKAVPITCTYPLFGLLLAVLLQGEQLTLQVVLGAVAIVAGIWLLTNTAERHAVGIERRGLIKGVVAAVLTAVVWASSIAMIDMAVTLPETSNLESALAVNTMRVLGVASFLLLAAPFVDRSGGFLRMKAKTAATLIVGGIVALALGWFFLASSFLYIPQSQAVPISSTSPLFAAVAGVVLLRERATRSSVAATVIIVVGIFLLFIV
jgi:DME family drug/metabolite transporter